MKSFRADYVFPVYADPIKNGVVTVDDDGYIISVSTADTPPPDCETEQLSGALCPGFINSHCHLELSHLKGKITGETGLINFVKEVQGQRGAVESEVTAAAIAADQEMFENGIVAVGDVCNSAVTAAVKVDSKLHYHNFVEVYNFSPEHAGQVFDNALSTMQAFKPQSVSIVPHAPYSVSKELFKLIKTYTDSHENLISMHSQECDEENKFFRYKLGGFVELYKFFGIDIDFFKPQARNSIQSVLPLLSANQPILMVHNTCTNLKDIYFTKRFDKPVSWCFCPQANLYIEKKLPKVHLFQSEDYKVMLGTDSLASNTGLCIMSEMRTLQQNFPSLKTAQIMRWATLNGANFFGLAREKGSLEVGKKPGLNLITNMDGLNFTPESKVRRLIS